jgi:hypothetical protein
MFSAKYLAIMAVAPAFFIVCLCVAFFDAETNAFALSYGKSFIGIVLPAYCFAMYCRCFHLEKVFLRNILYWGVFLLPGAVLYILHFFVQGNYLLESVSERLINIGNINYMQVAYIFLPIFAALVVQIIFEKHRTILYSVSAFVFGLAIVMSTTKNSCLSIAIMLVMAILLFIKCSGYRNRSIMILVAFLLVFFTYTFGVAQAIGEGAGRISDDIIIGMNPEIDIEYGDMVSVDENEHLRDLVAGNRPVLDNYVFSRMPLLKLSAGEIKKHLLGMGVIKFKLKYNGFYPHNAIAELIVETGVLIGGFAVAGIVFLFINLFRIVFSDESTDRKRMFLFICCFLPVVLLSGTVWVSTPLLFFIGYSILPEKENSSDADSVYKSQR